MLKLLNVKWTPETDCRKFQEFAMWKRSLALPKIQAGGLQAKTTALGRICNQSITLFATIWGIQSA